MLKKIATFTLMSLLSVSVLAACGSGDDDSEAEPTVTRAATSNAPAIATATVEGAIAAASAQAAGENEAEAPEGEEAEGGAAAAPGGGPVDLQVTAVDIAFEQKELSGPADTEFTITVTNNGSAQHDFVIEDLDVKTKLLNPGESETVTVNAPAGEYEYHCSVPGHKEAGMTGTLTLSEGGGAAAAPAGDEAAAPAGDQAAAGAPVDLAVTAVDIAFEQKELTGPADTEFTITVTNNGSAQHDFVIEDLGVETKMLNPGESETVTVNAPAGEYEYHCSVPGHKEAGMTGTLTLSADFAAAAPAGEEAAAPAGAASPAAAADEAAASPVATTDEFPTAASPMASPVASPVASSVAATDEASAGATALEVTAVDIAFEQKELSGPADTEFTITVTNNGSAQHDFVIDALNVKTKLLNPGESETVTVTGAAGDYEYYCAVPGHKAAGMVGTLTLQ